MTKKPGTLIIHIPGERASPGKVTALVILRKMEPYLYALDGPGIFRTMVF
jgi:hypothetical protein